MMPRVVKFIFLFLALATSSAFAQSVMDPVKLLVAGRSITVEREIRKTEDLSFILIHKKEPLYSDQTLSGKSLEQIVMGREDDESDNGWFIYDEWPWSDPANRPKFNCHAYATHEWLGLTPNDWLEGGLSVASEFTNPLHQIVSKFCTRISRQKIAGWNGRMPQEMTNAIRGGINHLLLTFESGDGPAREFVHSGIPVMKNGVVFLKSKFGEMALFAVSVESLLNDYKELNPEFISLYSCRTPVVVPSQKNHSKNMHTSVQPLRPRKSLPR